MPIIVDGKQIADDILEQLKKRIVTLQRKKIRPALAVVLVGKDKASQVYVKKKQEACERVGIQFSQFIFPSSISKQKLIINLKKIQSGQRLSGMILQLPVPDRLWQATREIANSIDLTLDVDCLTHAALGRVFMNESIFLPPTPAALFHILDVSGIDLKKKEVCVVGRGTLIGKPVASLLMHYPVTTVVCGRETVDLASYTRRADVIITGVGKHNLITADMVKKGAVVLDAGVCYVGKKMYGDVDFEKVKEKASLITPVPGGVGPITVAKLLENVVLGAEKFHP